MPVPPGARRLLRRTWPPSSSSTRPPGDFYADLDDAAATCLKILRAQAGSTTHDERLTRLVGELSTRSEDFRARWAAHDVGVHRAGRKTLHHHEVGELVLGFEELSLDSAPSIVLSTYIAEPASPTAERLQLLAAWNATHAPESARNDVEPREELDWNLDVEAELDRVSMDMAICLMPVSAVRAPPPAVR